MNDSSLPPILPEDNSGPGNSGADNAANHPQGSPPSPPEMSAPATPASHITVPEVEEPSAPPVSPEFAKIKELFELIQAEVAKLYVGQDELVLGTLTALFSGGHVLIESVPGLGKTLFVRTLGRILGCEFGRIQFTADLMPSDITGAPVFDMQTSEFRFRAGPVFTQLLLADEINRSPAKTHAALLEIMQELTEPATQFRNRFWFSQHRTRWKAKAPTTCPRLSWIGSCSS